METIQEQNTPQVTIGRRDFLRSIVKISGFISFIASFASIAVSVFPSMIGSKKRSARLLLPLESLPKDKEYFMGKVGERNFLLYNDKQTFTAYDMRCTHAGCTTQWQPSSEQFYCACHNGIFDKNGVPISGPPKKPLQKLTLYTEHSHIVIIE